MWATIETQHSIALYLCSPAQQIMSSDRDNRTMLAMGEAMVALSEKAKERGEDIDIDGGMSMSGLFDGAMKRAETIDALPKRDRELLEELCSFFDVDREKRGSQAKQDVVRAEEIIKELELNVNFPALPYGETFLSGAVYHSLGMVQLLLDKGADVNFENEMMSECALDKILEEEDDGELSEEKKAMKKLLLSKGAKTAEQRYLEMAESIRNGEE